MSGTSADGITAAVVRVGPDRIEPLAWLHRPADPRWTRWIHGLAEADAETLSEADVRIGRAFAAAAQAALRSCRMRVDLIASHGQTILHRPDRSHTLQLGEPSWIARETGVTTVAEFRPADMAAGGEGAPLVPMFDHFVFSGLAPAALLNLGGIANVTWVERAASQCRATDLGPANCMIDEAVRIATRGACPYDPEGRLAGGGRLDGSGLAALASHPFLSRPAPKSACRSDFVPGFLASAVGRMLRRRPLDAIATLTYFAAHAAADAIRARRTSRVIVSGGGVYNRTLMGHLRDRLFPVPVEPISDYGWHPLAKEPAAFALLGYRALCGLPNTLAAATGARREVVAGRIAPGANFRALLRRLA